MPLVKEVKLHYGCDSCSNHGTAMHLPAGWKTLQLYAHEVNKDRVLTHKAVLCPDCVALITTRLLKTCTCSVEKPDGDGAKL